jgi:hypothetical protein
MSGKFFFLQGNSYHNTRLWICPVFSAKTIQVFFNLFHSQTWFTFYPWSWFLQSILSILRRTILCWKDLAPHDESYWRLQT